MTLSRRKANAKPQGVFSVGADVQLDGPRRIETLASKSVEVARTRLVIASVLFLLGFGAVALRLFETMVLTGGLTAAANAADLSEIAARRGDIVDANGTILATSVSTASLYANPREIIDIDAAVSALLTVLPDIDVELIHRRLSSDRQFVWLQRNLTPHQHFEVFQLGIPGFDFVSEARRIYPQGAISGHVVGFTDVDGHGLAGVEQSFDEQLAAGEDIALSLDLRVQHIVREELAAGMAEFQAIGGAGIVMDVTDGRVVSLVSLPDFDPTAPGDADEDARFNRATLGVFELGSVFKMFNTAMALDAGVANVNSIFDATHPLRYGRFTINDFHAKYRPLSVAEILLYSSNIGSARLAMAAGTERQQSFMERAGMLERSPIQLPEVGAPLVPSPWREINMITIAFGHGLAVSPMQLASGYAAISNGGVMYPATLLNTTDVPVQGNRLISEETSQTMRRLLRMVVHDGSGRAEAPGYVVGGKTGTAEKASGRGYSESNLLSTFVGVFPMHDPRYVVLISLDEPRGNESTHGFATAGWVSAPIVSRIVSRIGPLMGVEPVDEDDPAVLAVTDLDGPWR